MFKRSAFSAYIEEIYEDFGHLPVWPPESNIELGDIGRLDRQGRFTRLTSLDDLNIAFEVSKTRGPGSNWSYRSETGVSINTDGKAEAIRATVKFAKANAVLFDLKGVKVEEIDRLNRIESALTKRQERRHWPNDYVVVASLVRAKNLILLISRSNNAQVTLRAEAGLYLGTTQNNLAGGFGIVNEDSMSTSLVVNTDSTPLYTVRKLHVSLVSKLTNQKPKLILTKSPSKTSAAKKATVQKIRKGKLQEIDSADYLDFVTRPANIE